MLGDEVYDDLEVLIPLKVKPRGKSAPRRPSWRGENVLIPLKVKPRGKVDGVAGMPPSPPSLNTPQGKAARQEARIVRICLRQVQSLNTPQGKAARQGKHIPMFFWQCENVLIPLKVKPRGKKKKEKKEKA